MIYLNGEFLPIEEARIPVLDRGFIFGDGVYELIPVYSRRPFRIDEHLARLQHSLDGIRLPNPHAPEEWRELITTLIAQQPFDDQSVYLHITRGVARRDHAFPPGVTPTVMVMANPLVTPTPEQIENGVAAVTAVDNRWLRCDIKAISLLPNVLLRQLAVDGGAAETILLRGGFMTEGAASNIFVVKDEIIFAPPKNNLMLPGITYDVVVELAQQNNVEVRVGAVPERLLRNADEIWQTSSTREVLAITTLDGNPVGNGRPGLLGQRMLEWYQAFKAGVMRADYT